MGVFIKWGTQNGWFTMDNPIQNGWFRGTTFLGNIHVSYIKYVIIQIIPKWRCTTLGSPHYLHMVNVPHVCRVIYCINLQADLCIRKCGSLWTSNQWNIRDLQYITHGTLTSSNHSNHGTKKTNPDPDLVSNKCLAKPGSAPEAPGGSRELTRACALSMTHGGLSFQSRWGTGNRTWNPRKRQ